MKRKLGLVALLPGFLSLNSMAADTGMYNDKPNGFSDMLDKLIVTPLNTATPIYLAGHRSHSSHRSHRSHSSHRSSSGGSYSPPPTTTPLYRSSDDYSQPSSSSYPAQNTTKAISTRQASGATQPRAEAVKRVQMSLKMLGYYDGAIDGVLGPDLRKGLLSYRVDKNLAITDEIDAEVLNSLGIAVP